MKAKKTSMAKKDKLLNEITTQAGQVIKKYKKEYPDVNMDRDYFPFKIGEEWGECLQMYLMLTDRGRNKGMSKKEIKELLSREMADVFGYLILFAKQEGVDLEMAIDKKWFSYLKKKT